tara:strand:- start:173 stop:454 length:282 start_codon:yes stop_codon:yes gene_type:complete
MQPQAEAVVAEVEQDLLTQVDLEEAVVFPHFQVLQEMQVVIVHPKEMTAVLQLTQGLTAVVVAVAIRQLVQVILENLEAEAVVEQQIQFQAHP